MRKYRAVYKCRMCGRTFDSRYTAAGEAAERHMLQLVAGVQCFKPEEPPAVAVHLCDNTYAGSMGLADFVGWEKEAEQIND